MNPLSEQSDARLLADDQDPARTFSLFYNRHSTAILGFCMARELSAHDAADVTSEVFVAALAQRYRFTDATGDGARPWLLGIARNTINGRARRSMREQGALERLQQRVEPPSTDDVEAYVLARERVKALLVTVQDLSDEQQAAFLGRHVHERTYPELAALEGVSELAARRRVSRAVEALRGRMRSWR